MASQKIKGITIEIDGNTTGLSNSLKNVNKIISETSYELRQVDKLLKLDPNNTDLLSQKHQLLSDAIKGTVSKLEQLKTAKEQADARIASGKESENSESYRELQREIISAEQNLGKLEEQLKNNDKALDDNAKGVKQLSDEEEKAGKSTIKLGDLIKANLISEAIVKGVKALASSIKGLTNNLSEWSNMSNALKEQEAKVAQVMKNTTGATDEEIQSIIDLTAAKEKLGVVSQETQLAGLQELGTYVENKESLEKLLPVMNDMIAQQYGVGASMESASSIATMMGKVLGNGQVGALSRLGYKFDETQEKVLKFGTEEEKAAMLAEVIEQSVGGMNEALAKTDAGKVAIAASYLDDMKKSVGSLVSDTKNQIIAEFVPAIQQISESIGQMLNGDISIEDGINKIIEGLQIGLEKVTEMLPQILDIGMNIITKLVEGMVAALPKILPTISTLVTTFVKGIGTLLPTIIQAGVSILLALIDGIVKSIPDLIPAIVDTLVAIVDTITNNLDLIISAGVDLIVALALGLVEAIPKLLEKIPTIIAALVTKILSPEMIGKLITSGIQLVLGLGKGLIQAIPQLLMLVPNIFKNLFNSFKDIITKTNWLELGKNILSGILNGMLDFGNIVKDTIKKVGSKITGAIKNFFGIASPSKLMKNEVGKYLAQGIGVGFEDEIPNVIKDVNNAMGTLSNEVQTSVNPIINPTANSNPLIIQIENFNNERETDVEAFAEELEFYRRQTALAKGGN